LALATPALATGPFHARDKARDISGLNDACGAAVDSEGNLYAASPGESKIKIFNEAKTEIGSISNANQPCGLAVQSDGTLYVSERATGEVVRYEPPSYGTREVIDASGQAKGISVDPFDNYLYVAEGGHVSVYDSKGVLGTINEVQRVVCSGCNAGSYKLAFEGVETTESIPFKGPAEEVKKALEKIPALAGNISVVNETEKAHLITFEGVYAHTDVPALVCKPAGIDGNCNISSPIKAFNGHIGEGELSKATGVAPYTYKITGAQVTRYLLVADKSTNQALLYSGPSASTLKLRRTIKGPKSSQNFEFGEAGTAVAADSANGHFFLYDDGAEALEELEATGEFLDSTTSPAFADAKPSAIAVDRSGGGADGAIYVGAGAGANARLLAFKPLTKPKREPLTALSGKLTVAKARAVATDRFGNIYIAAETKVYVYDNKGAKLLEIEDLEKAYDIDVDSKATSTSSTAKVRKKTSPPTNPRHSRPKRGQPTPATGC